MLLKYYKPKNNSLRNRILLKLKIYCKFKRLFLRLKKKNGKYFNGSTLIRARGGGGFFMYPRVDNYHFKYINNFYYLGLLKSKYHTGALALIKTVSGIKKYTLAPHNLKLNKSVKTTFFYNNSIDNNGDVLPIGWIPNNTLIYNLETIPFSGSKLIKSGGAYGKILSHTNNNVKVLLPSKKKKYFSKYCLASIGRVSNLFNNFQNYGKAGYRRNLNIRPKVNGENMNSYDHPNGGKTRGGKPTKNFWGKIIK